MGENEVLIKKVLKMANNCTCSDIFKNIVIYKDKNKYRMYEHKTNKKFYRDRRVKNELMVLLSKLKLILGLRSLTGILYIRSLLEKIEL